MNFVILLDMNLNSSKYAKKKYTAMTVKEVRDNLAEVLDRANLKGEYFRVTKFGKVKAYIVPAEDLETESNYHILETKKRRQNLLKKTSGIWDDMKGNTLELHNKLRKETSTRYGNAFN